MNRKMMQNLNLCTDPWLPVRMQSGDCRRLSLEAFFLHAREISDMVLAAHERIAIMRLLICITQRAINGPQDREEWDECKEEIVPKVLNYLQKWRPAFNLLGADGAFLQVSGVSFCGGSWKGLSKLNLSSAEGNNPTVFDNGAAGERRVELGRLAIDLITYQNFAPCGIIGRVNWLGNPYADSASAKDAPCNSVVHMFFMGENILETIWLNLCTIEEVSTVFSSIGKPVWECMPNGRNDEQSIENAQKTYLGRLVPLSRLVKIEYPENRCLLAMGIEIPVYKDGRLVFFEPFTTVVLNPKSSERSLVKAADMSRDMWRNLPALLHRFNSQGYTLGKLDQADLPEHYGIWVGALVSDNAKILGTMEDYYAHLSPSCIGAETERLHYELMEYANRGCSLCCKAVRKYCELLTSKKSEKQKNKNDKDNINKIAERAKLEFWSRMTSHKDKYVNLVRLKEEVEEWENELDHWLFVICDSAKATYELFAQRDNVRKLAAWSQALYYLPTKKILKDKR
ncbi:MAG: type I-E CRISPR-associated protein Cse1/CasA [Akkermansia sp.]|nr:type I-E CRISPR-associated protein Cse1/CasA [Akkermansia sp.]